MFVARLSQHLREADCRGRGPQANADHGCRGHGRRGRQRCRKPNLLQHTASGKQLQGVGGKGRAVVGNMNGVLGGWACGRW